MNDPNSLVSWLLPAIYVSLIVGSVLVVGYLILKWSAERRVSTLTAERRGINEESFIRHLAQYNFDPTICGTTYRYLCTTQRVAFPILQDDKLDDDLGLDSQEVEETVRDLLDALNRENAAGLQHTPLVTVEDLIRYLQASPRKSRDVAA